MKAFRTDGCGMGLVVAESEYRFLCWEKLGQRLYMAVRDDAPQVPGSITFAQAVHRMTTSKPEWDSLAVKPYGNFAKRNLYRIFAHLERQVQSVLATQKRGEIDDILIDGRPAELEGARFIEITGVWANLPGSRLPPSNGISIGRIEEAIE